jgi:DNA-binding transcriptional MerR regulator
VTVRALRHYDRLGLLKPERTGGGYRRNRESDLERLEHIVALKFIGVPLKIRALLDRDAPDLLVALRLQRRALEGKRRMLDSAISAVQEAELAIERSGDPDTSVLKRIIEVMEMQNGSDWMAKYFLPEAQEALEARRGAWTPELQARAERDWAELFEDIRRLLGEDPASPKAQAIVDRWNELLRAFLGGETQLVHGVKALYADGANWPAGFREQMAPFSDQRVWDFYRRAAAARASGAPPA